MALFGPSPLELQQQQQAVLQQRATAYGQQSPLERAASGMYMAGSQLGGGLAGLMGIKDPMAEQASKIQGILQGSDQTTAEGFMDLYRKFSEAGLPQQAQLAASKAKELEAAGLETRVKEATIAKNLREANTNEQRNAGGYADSVAARGTPEWNDAYKKKLEQLLSPDTGKANIKEIGTAAGTNEPIYLDVNKDMQFVYKKDSEGKQVRVPYFGGVDMTRSKVSATANASTKASEAGAVEIAKLDAKRLGEASIASDKAIEQAGVLKQLLNTPQPIAGAGAPSRVAALRVFSTLGLTSPKDEAALGNADTFNALAGERVLGFIKALGSNPTDTDREFARSIGPALEKGTKTNTDLTNYLLKRANETVQAASKMQKHFYDNDYSLKGYESPFMSNVAPVGKYSDLSDAELTARIKAAQAKK